MTITMFSEILLSVQYTETADWHAGDVRMPKDINNAARIINLLTRLNTGRERNCSQRSQRS